MKSIDLLAKSCETKQEPVTAEPDLSKVTDAMIARIADAVIAKLSSGAAMPDKEERPEPDDKQPSEEGSEEDGNTESGEVDQ